jgi:hypothetical protein
MITHITPRETELARQVDEQGGQTEHWRDRAIAAEAKVATLEVALADMLSGWRYIRQSHGDLYGVGWDRAQDRAETALGIGAYAPVPERCITALRKGTP